MGVWGLAPMNRKDESTGSKHIPVHGAMASAPPNVACSPAALAPGRGVGGRSTVPVECRRASTFRGLERGYPGNNAIASKYSSYLSRLSLRVARLNSPSKEENPNLTRGDGRPDEFKDAWLSHPLVPRELASELGDSSRSLPSASQVAKPKAKKHQSHGDAGRLRRGEERCRRAHGPEWRRVGQRCELHGHHRRRLVFSPLHWTLHRPFRFVG